MDIRMCDHQNGGRCEQQASMIGLLIIEDREIKVFVCDGHSVLWNALWGVWPIPTEAVEFAREWLVELFGPSVQAWPLFKVHRIADREHDGGWDFLVHDVEVMERENAREIMRDAA